MLIFFSTAISSTAFYARTIHGVIPAQHGLVRTLHHWPMALRLITQFLVLRFQYNQLRQVWRLVNRSPNSFFVIFQIAQEQSQSAINNFDTSQTLP